MSCVTEREKCPFKAGDAVVYRPSRRGLGLNVMTDLAKLVPGQKYKISRIVQSRFIVVEGFEHSVAGGLYWTEFSDD